MSLHLHSRRRSRRQGLLVAALFATAGCSPLHLRPDDSIGLRTVKVIGRIPVGVLTLGYSEWWHATERKMEIWLGRHRSELEKEWGPPEFEGKLKNGLTVLIYEAVAEVTTGGHMEVDHSGEASRQRAVTTQWMKMRAFEVDGEGMIVGYRWRGYDSSFW